MHTRTLRKKLAVRQALGSAALRLAVEPGLENVTVEDITAEADVSLRTFGNYFARSRSGGGPGCRPVSDRGKVQGTGRTTR